MNILAVGDITSPGGCAHLCKNLWRIREKYAIDFCIVNGENASFITGISAEAAEALLMSGADVITGGNHTMQNHAALSMLDDNPAVLRPINYGSEAPGRGYTIIDTGAHRVMVMNALGCAFIEPILDSPYPKIYSALEKEAGGYDIAVLDFHAEPGGEKLALAHEFDGKINVIFGTHTHIPTCDGQILPRGTGYITDLGMCGEGGGILGMEPESVIYKMKTKLPGKFKIACGECFADGVIFTLGADGKCRDIKRIKF